MISISKARLLAALAPVLLYTVYLHWYYTRIAAAGEETFIAHGRLRFQTYYANGGWGIHVFAAPWSVAVILGTYEVAAAVLAKRVK